jgi:hypothetical protein
MGSNGIASNGMPCNAGKGNRGSTKANEAIFLGRKSDTFLSKKVTRFCQKK